MVLLKSRRTVSPFGAGTMSCRAPPAVVRPLVPSRKTSQSEPSGSARGLQLVGLAPPLEDHVAGAFRDVLLAHDRVEDELGLRRRPGMNFALMIQLSSTGNHLRPANVAPRSRSGCP